VTRALDEARRQLAVCDACRYCEGYCAVFPALERRSGSLLLAGDVAQLANLCHDCRACYQACPFTPPHEFAVDVPALLGAARVESYERFAWPGRLGGWAFRHPSLAVVGTTAAGLALAVAAAAAGGGLLGRHTFYSVVPYLAMLVPALAVSAFVVAVLAAGFARFWRAAGGGGAAATTRTPSGRRTPGAGCTRWWSAAWRSRSRRRSRHRCSRTFWGCRRRTRC
jgi:citrate/tricarballylate utilization protein